MELNTNDKKFFNVTISFAKGFPLTINKGQDNEEVYPSLTELIHTDDIPPLSQLFADVSMGKKDTVEAHCRFKVKEDYHWFFISVNPFYEQGVPVGLQGIMCDVSNYLDSSTDDLVYKEFRYRRNMCIRELSGESIRLEEVLDKKYLKGIQKPFAKQHIYSAITDSQGKLICTPDGQNHGLKENDFKFIKKQSIRINHLVSGYWTLCAKTEELLNENLPLFETLVQTVSRMANAIVVVLREMDNAQNANKMLSKNVEEQILLNNIYDIIMKTPSSQKALDSILSLVGGYFGLDRISVIDVHTGDNDFFWSADRKYDTLVTLEGAKRLSPAGFPHIIDDLAENSASFSDESGNDLEKLGVGAYAIFRLFDSGSSGGCIAYEVMEKKRSWTQRERKQLRNISQIISSVIMRKNTQDKLDESNEKMQELAFYDSIFKVPNRTRLNKDLTAILENGGEGSLIAFKIANTRALSAVNGHSYADMLVRSIARYLTSLPVKDLGVYYFTNSIFMLNLPGCVGSEPKKLAEMLVTRFLKPWIFDGREYSINCCLGIAYYPLNGKTSEQLCKAASVAMYRARDFRKNSYTFFSGALEKSPGYASELEARFNEIIGDDMHGLTLSFQPVYELKTGKVSYVRAFPRMKDEKFGDIPDSTLNALAETTGAYDKMDIFVLEGACRFCAEGRKNIDPSMRVSVRIDSATLQSGAIISAVRERLIKYKLPADSLIIGIQLRQNLSYADNTAILSELNSMGVIIGVDCEGAEDVSLKALRSNYINIIAIPNRLLINGSDNFNKELTEAIVSLAHCRKMTVTANNVEDEAQLEIARLCGVDCVNGSDCLLSTEEISTGGLLAGLQSANVK